MLAGAGRHPVLEAGPESPVEHHRPIEVNREPRVPEIESGSGKPQHHLRERGLHRGQEEHEGGGTVNSLEPGRASGVWYPGP